ncbi:MAG TPA: hypothetical protein VGM03_23805 [Phycisphaerae bacterium]
MSGNDKQDDSEVLGATPDEIDLDDERWAREPKQIARGAAARERFARGEGISHEDMKRQLGWDE